MTVSYENAKHIDKSLNDPEIDAEALIRTKDGMSFRKGQINGVAAIPDGNERPLQSEDTKQFYEEERKQRISFLARPERHKDTNFFEFMCSISKKEVTPEMRERAQDIQRHFFATHPDRMYADPILFKEIIPGILSGLLPDAGWRVVENVIRRDLQLGYKK